MTCTYCSSECESLAGTPSGYCGDGTVQSSGGEECDEPTTRCPYGQMSCQTCSAQCKRVPGQLTGYCGDGTVQTNQGEACDPGASACCDSSCQVDVASCAPACLIISEYFDGSVDDKAIELYNCDSQPVGLTGTRICLVRNADTTCSVSYALTGSLAAGDTLTICNSNLNHSQQARCDVRESGVTVFNGDDRLVLYVDVNGDGNYSAANDIIADAFGQTNFRDNTQPWKDKLYSRCNFTSYDGLGTYDVLNYFQDIDEFRYDLLMNGFGNPPVENCL